MYLCIDIGGTKTFVASMNENRELIRISRFSTAFDQTHFLEMLTSEIADHSPSSDLKAISVAIPGPVESNKTLWLGNLPWVNFDIESELRKTFDVPIFLENDANLAGLAEAENYKGLSIYFTFSTGIGGGIVRDGHLDNSIRIYEPGHDQYEFNGRILEWEDFASAKAVSENYGKLTSEITNPSDWKEISSRIAIGMRSAVSSIRPDRIIFGGPLGLELDNYRRHLKKLLESTLPAGVTLPSLVTAKYQHHSVLYGCFIYAQQELARR